jgi:hypothetical protein
MVMASALVFGGLVAGVGAFMRWRALPLARRTYRHGIHSLLHGGTSVDDVERWYRTTGVVYIVVGLALVPFGALVELGVVSPPPPPDVQR